MKQKKWLCFYALSLLIGSAWGQPQKNPHLRVQSSAFGDGDMLSKKYTCDGDDLSPPLSWDSIPPGTKSFVIICDDPDAPNGTWDHWIVYNIPADQSSVPEGFGKKETERLGGMIKQGLNSWNKFGYGGACPPKGHGVHRYIFTVYALSTTIGFGGKKAVHKSSVLAKVEQCLLAKGTIIAKYKRD